MDNKPQETPELTKLRNMRDSGYNYRERRHDDWTENYTLYRDKVIVNRLTQRQSVNVPLMKQMISSLFKDVDDMPVIQFENLDNDKQAEVFQNEYWKWTLEMNNAELFDAVDKKQDFLFGRSFDQMQIVDGRVKMTVQDPMDMLVDRYCDPTDIDSSRFLIHTHIFMPLSAIEANESYDKEEVARLKLWHAGEAGLVKSKENEQAYIEKQQRLIDLGLDDATDPILGETIVELSVYMYYDREEGDEDEQIYHTVVADDMAILMEKPQEEIVGKTEEHYWKNHYLYNSWADDVDRQDFWTDGKADIVRTPNKIVNAWISQLVENRTLRNFGMNYYDSGMEGFQPQTWEPRAWGMYGVPVTPGKNLTDVFMKVDIPDLSESLDEMQYVIGLTEKATGATATQQGAQTERNVTLGEVQLALGEAKARIQGMSKFYTHVWKKRAEKFLMLIEAGHDKLDAVKIYKKGRNTNDMYTQEISPNDWMTKSGYTTRVWSQDDKDAYDTQALQKLSAVKANMPDNMKLDEVYKRKLLEFADLTPEEVNDIMDAEIQMRQQVLDMQMMAQGQMGMSPQPQQQVMPPAPVAQPAQKA